MIRPYLVWPSVFAVSIAAHAGLAAALATLAEPAGDGPVAELVIGDAPGFTASVLAPAVVESTSTTEAQSASRIEPVHEAQTASAATSAAEKLLPAEARIQPQVRLPVAMQAVESAPVVAAANADADLAPVTSGTSVILSVAPGAMSPVDDAEATQAAAAPSTIIASVEPSIIEIEQQASVSQQVVANAGTESVTIKPSDSQSTLSATTAETSSAVTVSSGDTVAAAAPQDVQSLQPTATAGSAQSVNETVGAVAAATSDASSAVVVPSGDGAIAAPLESQPLQPAGAIGTVQAVGTGEALASVAATGEGAAVQVPVESAAKVQQLALAPPVEVMESLGDRVLKFVRGYDGGDCFVAMPLEREGARPRIEGYGLEAATLTFKEAFHKAVGTEAEIGIREVTEGQCPAIGYIGALLRARLPELGIDFDRDEFRSGGNVSGIITGVTQPWLTLFVVDDDGLVHDISNFVSRAGEGLAFAAPVVLTAEGRARYQLVVGVASSRELASLIITEPVLARELFPRALDEAARSGADVAIGIGAFKVR